MDRNGDTRHRFNPNDAAAVAFAKQRFEELTRNGYRAVALGRDGESGRLLDRFEPNTERTLFIPQLRGG
jgi:hypothetical protein